MGKYYIKQNGKVYGPVDENKIHNRIASGFFSTHCLISPNQKDWVPVYELLTPPVMLSAPDRTSQDAYGAPVYRLSSENLVGEPKAQAGKPPRAIPRYVVIACAAVSILLLFCFCFGAYFLLSPILSSHRTADFQQICEQYQSAVGVVVVALENSEGKLLENSELNIKPWYPIGTAFAIGPNLFATNCHVAYGIKDQKQSLVENVLMYILFEQARQEGVRTREDFQRFLKKNEEDIQKAKDFLTQNLRVRNVEIRLAHSGGKSLQITGVQIHPRYQAMSNEHRNGEFDVALLTTGSPISTFFKIAPPKVLYKLAAGQHIAYIGFPMEGLHANGNLDINNPEATFKSGSISKVTDFNNVASAPERNKSITHDIPATGGASGSPIFLPDGQVVAILWGVNFVDRNSEGRVASAVQMNWAVRIDSLDAVRQQPMIPWQEWVGRTK